MKLLKTVQIRPGHVVAIIHDGINAAPDEDGDWSALPLLRAARKIFAMP
jgi:hypothetical protein